MKNWFRHDSDSWLDEKTIELRLMHGLAGYGFFWAIIEMISTSDQLRIKKNASVIAAHCGIEKPFANQLVSDCLAIGLLSEEGEFLVSQSLVRRMEHYRVVCAKRKEAGKLGGRPKANKSGKLKPIANQAKTKANLIEENRIDQNRIDLTTNVVSEDRVAYAPRMLMTQESYDKLFAQYGHAFTEELAKASDWTLAKGKSHKDAAAFMRNWMKRAAASSRLANVRQVDFKSLEHENRQKREREAIEAADLFLHPKQSPKKLEAL